MKGIQIIYNEEVPFLLKKMMGFFHNKIHNNITNQNKETANSNHITK
jgi:hypothetical protein